MKNRIIRSTFLIVLAVALGLVTNSVAFAQYGPGVVEKLKGSSAPTQTLTGVIRVPKSFGVIPSFRGSSRPGSPCGQFYVAVLDPENRNKPINTTTTEVSRDDGEFYTCKYRL